MSISTERLRRECESGGFCHEMAYEVCRERDAQAAEIAELRAKLAKYDDAKPVDKEWCREQFGEPGDWFGELYWAIAPHAKACIAKDGIEIVVGLQRVLTTPTRGQLLHLIDGLGVRA